MTYVSDGAGVDYYAIVGRYGGSNDGYYVVKDTDNSDPNDPVDLWEAMVDKYTGCIFAFRDLSDAGHSLTDPNITGGHLDAGEHLAYQGTSDRGGDDFPTDDTTVDNYAYYFSGPMFWYESRDRTVFRGHRFVDSELDGRLTYAWDANAFTITYDESSLTPGDANTVFLWDNMYRGDPNDPNTSAQWAWQSGDIQTTLTFQMNKAGEFGTEFVLTDSELLTDRTYTDPNDEEQPFLIDPRIWFGGDMYLSIHIDTRYVQDYPDPNVDPPGTIWYWNSIYGIDTEYDGNAQVEEGEFDPADPKSYGRYTVTGTTNNVDDLGLTNGRSFIIDMVDGVDTAGVTWDAMGVSDVGGWGPCKRIEIGTLAKYGSSPTPGTTKLSVYKVLVNIGTAPSGVPAAANCGVAATSPHMNDGADASTVTVTVRDGYGLPVVGLPASDVVVSCTGTNNITQPSSATDSNGQTTATITTLEFGIKTVSATVAVGGSPQAIPQTAEVQFFSTGVALGYSYIIPSNHASYNYVLLVLQALKAGVPFSEFQIVVPEFGNETTHAAYCPGLVYYFKDLTLRDGSDPNEPVFDYVGYSRAYEGMMLFNRYRRWSTRYWQNEVKNPLYYEWEVTDQHATHPFTTKVRINVPAYKESGPDQLYKWPIDGTLTVTNLDPNATYGLASSSYIGALEMKLRDRPMGSSDANDDFVGDFVNYDDPIEKPNVHDQFGDDHPLWACTDWYGTILDLTDANNVDPPLAEQPVGGLIQAVVKDNVDTASLGMVPGAVFKMEADWFDYQYLIGRSSLQSEGTNEYYYPPSAPVSQGTVRMQHYQAYVLGVGAQLEAAGDPNGQDSITLPYSAEIDFGYGEDVLDIDAALDFDWVYQNYETTTSDGHISTLTITLVSESQPGETYTVAIDEGAGPGLTNFTMGTPAVVGNTLVVDIIGGRAGTTTANAPGSATLTVTVTGDSSAESDDDTVTLQLRKLGDLDGSGGDPIALDKQNFNKRLNGVATGLPDRAFDLDATGGEPNAQDKQLMNKILNGVALP